MNGHVDATTSTATVVFEFQDASGLRARKKFAFDPNGYVVTFSADVAAGDRAINPTIAWGPGLGDIGARRRRRQLLHRQLRAAAAGDSSSRRRRRANCHRLICRTAGARRRVPLRRHRRSLLPRCRVAHRPGAAGVHAGDAARLRRRRSVSSWAWPCGSRKRQRTSGSSSVRSSSTSAGRRPGAGARHQLRHVRRGWSCRC